MSEHKKNFSPGSYCSAVKKKNHIKPAASLNVRGMRAFKAIQNIEKLRLASSGRGGFLAGFTMVEILIVSLIIVVIGFAIYSVFVNGVVVWYRITNEVAVEDVNFFFERIASDLRNSFLFSEIKYVGTEDSTAFPTLVKIDNQDTVQDQIGRVRYSFEKRTKTIKREQATYSELYSQRNGNEKVLLTGVESCRFQYYYYDTEVKKYFWISSWQDETFFKEDERIQLPSAVRVALEIQGGSDKKSFERTIYLFQGG